MTNIKILLVCTIFISGVIVGKSHAAVNCQRIGEDPYNTRQSIYIDGDTGLYSYIAYNGERQVEELLCGFLTNEGNEAVICSRVFEREEGLTTEHYVIARLSRFTTLQTSSFVENASDRFATGQHRAMYSQVTMTCTWD